MAIWFKPITVDDLNKRGQNTLSDFLGIRFTDISEDAITATMPVNERSRQPIGILHGGANVVLAETIASTAANAVVDIANYYCVGLEINANHIRSVREGVVTGVTRPIHLGRTTQIWQIDIYNEAGKRTCVSRMTASVLAR
ncbi:hotdog fold thioesterase [Legionella spiritensis]|uniref:Esterase n=1 Tax=Legionella spiritensis TaxID=452 RepID=A0A0W0Z6U3_LEGSP|nr:hotdog fold thioesterase [Legionella spiritensis]KTD64855.1 esterase [Legionella spiritensis]SNV40911.1 esterase [Legionella spiritensis]